MEIKLKLRPNVAEGPEAPQQDEFGVWWQLSRKTSEGFTSLYGSKITCKFEQDGGIKIDNKNSLTYLKKHSGYDIPR